MESIYIGILLVLFLLAISDLIVGVSNDAVNFLVSALGSKAAPFAVVMIVASLGVLVGATFSSGMMEVARKGIFHPDKFFFGEIMIVFVAVMLTDIILLDLFNTFGMPTSTTVSIVFELLGSAVALAVFKSQQDGGEAVAAYINTKKAWEIIRGIFLSVFFAFTIGAIVQYISRVLFSFKYQKSFRTFGAIWGGVAVTAITYFILIKGLKGSSFISETTAAWIKNNTMVLLGASFVVWTVVLYALQAMKVNVLKVIVLIGTFALAMAFAGNDLVNFIGVPLAGLKSYQAFIASEVTDPMAFSMEILSEKVKTPTLYLLIAGLIMVVTLWMSKKARTVTETSINLSRQEETNEEQFESSAVSRVLVRISIFIANLFSKIVPDSTKTFLNRQLTRPETAEVGGDGAAAFDLIRASVNLSVASILISVGTSLKLPLSTTYVTFMVAMGTSLADGAWGRSTAVYRITGVLSVISGWFITGIVAFIVSYTFATLIHSTGLWMVFVILGFVGIGIWTLRIVHKRKQTEKEEDQKLEEEELVRDSEEVFEKCIGNVAKTLKSLHTIYDEVTVGLDLEDRQSLKSANKSAKKMTKRSKRLKENLQLTIKQLETENIESGYYYVQVVDYLREIARAVNNVTEPSYNHVDNNHTKLAEVQLTELKDVTRQVGEFIKLVLEMIRKSNFSDITEIEELQNQFALNIKQFRLNHFDRIKKDEAGPKNSLLYLSILTETQNIILFTVTLLKAQRDFVS